MERFSRRSLIRDDSYNKSKDPLFMSGGFSWPPRSYNCSFCKREFKSAQALGGHMNVHRRDRARLRQSPPWDPIPYNPNPNSNSPSTSSNYPLPNLNFSPPPCTRGETKAVPRHVTYTFISQEPFQSICDVKLKSSAREVKALLKVKNMKGFDMEEQKEEKFAGVDLKIGVSEDVEEELDLELRLGYT